MTARRQIAEREPTRWAVKRGLMLQGYVTRRQAGPGKLGYQALTTDLQDVGPLHASLTDAMAFLDTDPVAAWLARDTREEARRDARENPERDDAGADEPYALEEDPDYGEVQMQRMEHRYERQVYGD